METADRKQEYLVITPFFPTPERYNGPFIYDLVKALQEHSKYNVEVFKPVDWRERCEDYEYDGIPVHCFRTYDLPSYMLNGVMNPINVCSFKRKLHQVGVELGKIKIAHGHTVNCGAYVNYLKKQNKDIITLLHHHDPDPYKIIHGKFYNNPINKFLRAYFSSKEISRVDWNVSVSEKVQDNLLAFPKGGPRESYIPYLTALKGLHNTKFVTPRLENCIVLYNGVDKEKFFPGKKDKSKRPLPFTIGINANYVDWKRHEVLVDAVKILVDQGEEIRLHLLGTNPESGFEHIKAYIRGKGLDSYVRFFPPCDHRETKTFYQALDLFVLPSIFEGFGCVFTEAYACGVPFMSCKGQAIEELVKDDDRKFFFFDQDSPESLANLIKEYMRHPKKERLCKPIVFNELIPDFLNTVTNVR